MTKGAFRLDVNLQFHDLSQIVHGDSYVSFRELQTRSPQAARNADLEFEELSIETVLRYALSDRTELSFAAPYRRVTVRVDEQDQVHRNETLDGPGDIRLGLRHFVIFEETHQVSILGGLSFPTGKLNKVTAASYIDPPVAEALGITLPRHSHLRLGTGTVDPFFGVDALFRLDDNWMIFGSAHATVPFYENRYDYRTSPSAAFTAGPAVRVADGKLILGLFGEVTWSGRDRFDGADIVGTAGVFDGDFGVPNTGRFEFAIRPTLTWSVNDKLTLNVSGRVPVYTRIREDAARSDVQLTEDFGLFVGMTINF